MLKRVISLILCSALVFSIACFSAFAGESNNYDTCTHEWEQPIDHWYGIPIPGTDITFGVDVERCSKCGLYKHTADLLVLKSTYYSPLPPHLNGIVPSELTTYWLNVWYKTFGKNATATKFTPGGGSTSGGGVGRPKGYADDNGTPNLIASGSIVTMATPIGLGGYWEDCFFSGPSVGHSGKSGRAESEDSQICAIYKFVAPVDGFYYLGSDLLSFDGGRISVLDEKEGLYNSVELKRSFSKKYELTVKLSANRTYYLLLAPVDNINHSIVEWSLNDVPILCDPYYSSNTNYNSINIYNNTWNGNIYVDNSNNLTYIYPQYTTVNEKNETVTNISNTPIIYNNETYQYYTYDQTTKNYYYITYPNQPTPPPTASPSPSPAPTETPSLSPSPAPVEPILPANRFRIIPNMTGNTFSDSHGTWSAFGSSEYSSSYTYFRAFNDGTSYWWTSSPAKRLGSYDREMPCWLAIEIPDPENYYIDGYVLKGAGSGIYYDDWQFQYSDDGSTWTDLDSVSDGGLKDQKEHDFNVSVHKAHKYYRWYFTKAPVSWPGLGTANLYGYNAKDVVTPTPSPSPAPDPGKPGGDKTGILAVLVEIRDNMIQGFLDIKAAFVAGFAELSANFTLAIENLNLNITNIFNKKFPDKSTPETAAPSPSPSPAPDPGTDPTPVPTPGGGTVPAPGGNSNISGGDDEGLFGWIWDLLKDIVKSILKAIFKIIANILGFLIWIVERVGLLLPFLPGPAVSALGAGVVLVFVIRIIRFIRG